jgi:hypothetical protein
MAWGLGQFLFGWVAWRSVVLPNWLAIIGMRGGVAGLLTLAVYQTAVLALVQLLAFTIWGFATGLSLLRARQPTPQPQRCVVTHRRASMSGIPGMQIVKERAHVG